jgi:hypothetical protein
MDAKQPTYPLLSLHLARHTQQLTDRLSHGLTLESQLPSTTKRYSHLLIRLGEDELARSMYLKSRASYIGRKVRAMQSHGAYGTNEIDAFVEAIAWLTIRVVKNSWTVYSETFSESRVASSFVEWVKEQVEGMFSLENFLLIGKCMQKYSDVSFLDFPSSQNYTFEARPE